MDMSRARHLLGFALLVACSSEKAAAPSGSASAQPSGGSGSAHEARPVGPPTGAIIEIQELTIRFEGFPIARLHADGRTESVGNEKPGKDAKFSPGPTLRADGTIELTKGGMKARVEADGDIFVISPPAAGQPEQLYGRVTGDRLETKRGADTGVRLEGSKLVAFYEGKPTSELGVIEPPTMGRTALILTAAFFMDLAITRQ